MLKKMMKKVCVMLTAATVLLSCIGAPSVFAAATTETVAEINGWKLIMYSGNDSFHNTFKQESSISLSTDWARGGAHSVKIVYPNKPKSEAGVESGATFWLGLSAQSIGILEPGTYKLTYSLRAVDKDGKVIDGIKEDGNSNSRDMYTGKHTPLLKGGNGPTIGNGNDRFEFVSGTNGNYTVVTRTTTISDVIPADAGAYRKNAPSQSQIDEFLTIKFNNPFNAYKEPFNNEIAAVYIDEISLKRDGSDEELLINGSFENNEIKNPVYGRKAVVADTAVGTQGNVSLTWKNPSEALKSVKLYDITDGNETEITDGFTENLTAGAKNSVVLANVARERRYYKVVNTFTDDSVSEFILSADAAAGQRDNVLVNGWTAKDNKVNGYINKTVANIDTNIKHSGESSLHIRSGRSEYKDNEKLEVFQTLPDLDEHITDGYYKMSMWVKKNNVDSFFTKINNGKINDGPFPGWKVDGSANNFYLIQPLANNTVVYTHNWQYFEYVFSPAKDTSLGLANAWTKGTALNWAISQFDTADDVWIDDVTFVKCDANGKTLSGAENLVKNGGFELSDEDKVTGFNADEVTAAASDGAITISYPQISAGEKVNIYFTDDDGIKEFKGSLYEDKKEFTFKNLVNKKVYEITVAKASAVNGAEQTEPVVLNASPVPPAVVIGDYVLTNESGASVADAKTPGKYNIKINVANNTVDEGYDAYLIYALYDGENKMVDFGYYNQTIAVDQNADLAVENINVKEGYTLKAFLWNGFETIKPIKPYVNFSK